ncbi:MAG: class I SAM-dependent methyltransferase [Phycisphaerales bacterium]|nr:class I SAM-dependent methyltransferase [Phycisphaerales bacterium]
MSIPHSLNAPDRALPLLAAFFAPLTALGCAPRRIVGWLRESGLTRRHTLLDLGCGKGAVAIAAGEAIGCHTVGVDAFEPFLASARAAAERSGIDALCDFRRGDVHRFGARPRRTFDAVVMLNVLPFDDALPIARRLTAPGGVYILDDAVLVRGASAHDSSAHNAPTAAEVRAVVEHLGDRVEREHIDSRAEVLRRGRGLLTKLRANARTLARQHPRHAALIRECLERQRDALTQLAGPIRPACWLVRRSR